MLYAQWSWPPRPGRTVAQWLGRRISTDPMAHRKWRICRRNRPCLCIDLYGFLEGTSYPRLAPTSPASFRAVQLQCWMWCSQICIMLDFCGYELLYTATPAIQGFSVIWRADSIIKQSWTRFTYHLLRFPNTGCMVANVTLACTFQEVLCQDLPVKLHIQVSCKCCPHSTVPTSITSPAQLCLVLCTVNMALWGLPMTISRLQLMGTSGQPKGDDEHRLRKERAAWKQSQLLFHHFFPASLWDFATKIFVMGWVSLH